MHIKVNGVRLYFDVEGAAIEADGASLRTKPTLIALHGGPGFDHSALKPELSSLKDIAQIVYLDHRGNGQSEDGPADLWVLRQWAEDVHGFCAALGIRRPIVFGHSFGGFVAIALAIAHPGDQAALILANTAPRLEVETIVAAFRARGGEAAAEAAQAFLTAPSPMSGLAFSAICRPLYSAHGRIDEERAARQKLKADVLFKFFDPAGEDRQMDFRGALARLDVPALILSGAHDPITPPVYQGELAALLPRSRLATIPTAGHFLSDDWPAYERAIRAFLADLAA